MPRLDVPYVRVNLGTLPLVTTAFEIHDITLKASDLPVRERDLIPTKNWRARSGGPHPGGALRGKFHNLTVRWTSSATRPTFTVGVYGDAARTHFLGHYTPSSAQLIQVGLSATTFTGRVPAGDTSTSYFENPIPYRDDDDAGTFYFRVSTRAATDIVAGAMELELEFVPEYPV